jgi:hypothetical protein
MNLINLSAVIACLLVSSIALAGETVTIPADKNAPRVRPSAIKKSEQITVSGPLQVVPLQGATLTLTSATYGFVVIGKVMDIDIAAWERLEPMAKVRSSVSVTGTLQTLCDEKGLRAETLGCRQFDLNRSVFIEKR